MSQFRNQIFVYILLIIIFLNNFDIVSVFKYKTLSIEKSLPILGDVFNQDFKKNL